MDWFFRLHPRKCPFWSSFHVFSVNVLFPFSWVAFCPTDFQEPMRNHYFLFLLLFGFPIALLGQNAGIRGVIRDAKGEPVPFASIGVEKTAMGSMANAEGRYSMPLPDGTYAIFFKCLGFQTSRRDVTVNGSFETVDVVLSEQVIQTREVTIASRNEDPAYSIMRKAIARAKVNKLLVEAYTADVYIRGSGRILDLPFFLRGMAKENGFDENTVFFKETREKVEFKQPNHLKEKVIASRSTFGMAEISQPFIKDDLYNPTYMGGVSPLSPSAFRYYKFRYLGAFTDHGQDVFKIQVIAKVDGANMWEGEISILDKTWCIQSAKLSGVSEGFKLTLAHTYAPFEGVWMPMQIRQDIRGKVLQIELEAVYNASIRNYKITRNEKLYADYKKLEQEIDTKTDEVIKKDPVNVDLKALEKQEKKIMRKMVKEYVKQKYFTKKSKDTPPVPKEKKIITSTYEYEVDSNATKYDSIYWMENRLVPLTQMEIRSFHKLDSIRIVEEKKDSTNKDKDDDGPNVLGYLMGKTWYLGKKDSMKRSPWRIQYFSPLSKVTYSPIEGYGIEGEVWAKYAFGQSRTKWADDRLYIQFGPRIRYAFGRKEAWGSGLVQLGRKDWTIELSGGTELRQFNNQEPISYSLNSSYALLSRKSFIRQYMAEFATLKFLRKLTGTVEAELILDWSNRIPIQNALLKDRKGNIKNYPANQVFMPEVPSATLLGTRAAQATLQVDWYPFMEATMYNQYKAFNAKSSPRIRFEYNQAFNGVFNSEVDFGKLGLSWRQSIALSRNSDLEIFARGATFLWKNEMGQMDALQVLGNQTFVLGSMKVEAFRNVNYYTRSSSTQILEGHLHWYRNELLLGWFFPKTRKWRELVFVNGLMYGPEKPILEYGYGLDQLFRILHMEAVYTQLPGFSSGRWSFMLGTSFSFGIQPKSYDKATSDGVNFSL